MANNAIRNWIVPNLFENVLQETVKDYKKILNFNVVHALAPGENYATVMLRIQIEMLLTTDKTCYKSFMLKVAQDSEYSRHELNKMEIFTIESNMYSSVKPELENFYKEIGLDVHFGATSYNLATDQDYILLEDLTNKGFRNANRLQGLDMEHCKSVLKKMAQWHAATAVRIERKGLYEGRYSKGILNEKGKEVITVLFSSSFKHLLRAAKKLKNHEEYLEQIKALESKIIDLFYQECAPKADDFNVLNHGDCWCNNIMFKYDKNGKVQDTYFVDYQIPCYGSPAQDLLYFIISSAQLNIKVNKFDYMIKYYHDNLVEHLTLLKYEKKIPSLKEIHQSLFKYGLWGLFAVSITLPVVLADSNKDATADNFIGAKEEESDKFKELIFSNERISEHFEVVLPWLCNRGTFEY